MCIHDAEEEGGEWGGGGGTSVTLTPCYFLHDRMGPAVLMWLVLACCVPVVAAGPQDHVLRFLSQEDIARMAKETKEPTDDIIIVSDNKYKGQPLEKVTALSV